MPQFSVVVPVHDVRDYLRQCLDSVLTQDVDDLEVIAVDDASTDDSGAVLDEYAGRDGRVRVVHLTANVGLGAARNTAIAQAAGDYLVFVDSDDALAAGALPALQRRISASGPVDVAVYSFVRTFEDGREEPDPRSIDLLKPDDTPAFPLDARPDLIHLFPAAWTKAVRTDFVREHGFAFAPGYYEDLPWTFPVLVTATRIVTLSKALYRYRQRRQGTILSSSGHRHLEIIDQFDRVFAFLDDHPELDRWRPVLYQRMTRQLPTVLEMGDRIPPELRRHFFGEIADAFRRHRPAGYSAGGAQGVKVGLIERGDYRLYSAAERANDLVRRVRTRPRGRR